MVRPRIGSLSMARPVGYRTSPLTPRAAVPLAPRRRVRVARRQGPGARMPDSHPVFIRVSDTWTHALPPVQRPCGDDGCDGATTRIAPAGAGVTMSGTMALQVRGLRKSYGGVLAVESLDLEVAAGVVL